MQTTTPVREESNHNTFLATRRHYLFPFIFPLLMACALLLVAAILPLYGLWFSPSLLADLNAWLLLPTQSLFPERAISPAISLLHVYDAPPPSTDVSWQETAMLFGALVPLGVLYIIALRYLPSLVSRRYVIISTVLLGLVCALFFTAVTSPDLFSYIAYARMGVFYALNPLTTLPGEIKGDPVYQLLYWRDQPSAYGPTWAVLSCALQWGLGHLGVRDIAPMVVALRLLGLGAHLWSVLLVWAIGGHMQRLQGVVEPRKQMQATLAFAWNPLLLFEACVNAHNDAVVLVFVLLAVWLLVRGDPATMRTQIVVALMLALGTCLKVNVVLLAPGFLLFLWSLPRRLPLIGGFIVVYGGMIIALYAPFWQQGELLNVIRVNPGANRNINSLADFGAHFYNGIASLQGAPIAAEVGSPAEIFMHTVSLLIFVAAYVLFCLRYLHPHRRLCTPFALLCWLSGAWLLYCATGAPWFWPWYSVVFFGLFALVEATHTHDAQVSLPLRLVTDPLMMRLFAFCLLSVYCFYSWAPYDSFVPSLPGFRWSYLRGLWIWCVPLAAIGATLLAARIPNRTKRLTEG